MPFKRAMFRQKSVKRHGQEHYLRPNELFKALFGPPHQDNKEIYPGKIKTEKFLKSASFLKLHDETNQYFLKNIDHFFFFYLLFSPSFFRVVQIDVHLYDHHDWEC